MLTILIVDDEKLERNGIKFLLKREKEEFRILEAANGKDALGVLASNHVDILFSDVKMPYMSGLELVCQVREKDRNMDFQLEVWLLIPPCRPVRSFPCLRSFGSKNQNLVPPKLRFMLCSAAKV